MTNDTLMKEVTRIEKVMSALEQFTKHQVSELQSLHDTATQDTQTWQVNFEDLQARKILEIHSAVKVLNQNFQFIQKDAKDKFDILTTQQRENIEQVMMQIKDLKKHFKGGLNNSTTVDTSARMAEVTSQSQMIRTDSNDIGVSRDHL